MVKTVKPGMKTGPVGGIYEQVGPRGGKQGVFTTLPEHRKAPPTTKPDSSWVRVKTTPKGSK